MTTSVAPLDELYRVITELTSDYLYALRVEADGSVTREWSTETFTKVTGYAVDEIDEPGAWQRLVYPEDLSIAFDHVVKLLAGERHEVTYRIITKDGKVRWLRDVGQPVRDEGEGRVVRIFGAARDVTEAREAERMQRELIAMISHELRNPLAALRGYAQLLQRRQRYDEQAVTVMLSQVDRLNRLISDLVDASRLETGRLELNPTSVDLLPLVEMAASGVRMLSEGHTVRVEAPRSLPSGNWDRDRVDQVLQNLLDNAVKYAPPGEVQLRVEDVGSGVRVTVHDSGPGIDRAELGRLFERYYRPHGGGDAAGFGLGLFICRGLVERHGGRIWAESAPGEGATFVFELPYSGGV